MSILKSSIFVVLLLSACEAYGPGSRLPPPVTEAVPVLEPVDLPVAGSRTITGALPRRAVSPIIPSAPAIPARPRNPAEVAFIKATLNALQPRSIVENREYCGYLGLLPDGEYAVSPPKRGAAAGCTPDNPPANLRIIASYHTHAAYAQGYDSEVPSATDLEGDIDEGVNGYVSTPGGRLWFNNAATRSTVQLCGIGCLSPDPRFQPEREMVVSQSYTLAALQIRQN